ncbi:response regulator transcription factor [Candidatus Enterococcus courvalinii]|uniref:Response regulator transcription factor n=1 Tax=Candidatus Enterococcus courvalinii TaxID=2815329 RepID=A0ABS3I2J4_9ENTE|nr:response regulator transcription factor [Enterococcus sp. MSG2901]MBO0482933.1 response regulator transcription factor [Enterococcus sp. MSG2901]
MYKVLLVDDEYMILNGLKKIVDWSSFGFEIVATAENAMEGLLVLEKKGIDLVITDVTMPEMNGLEFIEAAQKEQYAFEFMILSGYQEFEYLKGGMQLGAVNYLMKPVNKIELIESLKKVKERLDQQNEQKNQQEIYQELLFSQWLNEELDETSEEEFLNGLPQGTQQILLIQLERIYESAIIQWLKEHQVTTYYQRSFGNLTCFTILLSPQKGNDFCHYFQMKYPKQDWLISMGDEIGEVDDIPESFRRAKDQLQLQQFYGETRHEIIRSIPAENQDQLIDFSTFSRALQSNQLDLVQQMIREFFEQFQSAVMTPEDIRHFTFLLFMDIQRELITLEDDEYLKGIQQINQAKNVNDLQELLLSLIRKQQKQKNYSENIKQVLQILHENYREPLTLKEVSESLHLNVMYLGQLFKKETKKSFSTYLNHLRMEQAKWLLLHSEQNINEISNEIGYNNTTYFSKLFKKIVGQSPKEY